MDEGQAKVRDKQGERKERNKERKGERERESY